MQNAMDRNEAPADTGKQVGRKKIGPIVVLLAGLLLLTGGVIKYVAGTQGGATKLDYRPEDVAYDQPLQAIHEMGGGPPIPFLPTDQPQPDIEVKEASYDFGRIGPSDVVQRTFVVRNVGEAPLTISRAYTTCGCTTAELTSAVIPPGKVSLVTIKFDAGFHDTAGQTVRRGLIIENNDPRQSQAEIWIQAAVNQK